MAYSSFNRVLRETSLERKCRLLFAPCLLLSILIAFVLVDIIAENLVNESQQNVIKAARRHSEAYIDISLLKLHFNVQPLYMQKEQQQDHKSAAEWMALIKRISESLDHQDYQFKLLSLEDPPDGNEAKILVELEEDYRAQKRSLPAESARPAETTDLFSRAGVAPVFKDMLVSSGDRTFYQYYQPVYWKQSCLFACHDDLATAGSLSAAEGAAGAIEKEPFRVAKVVTRIERPATAEIQIRAILIAVGIGAFFLAMIALYIIVKYIIIKPLKHLTDVSNDISRGKTELRAELKTNDEFEELAASFNRMLRHLTETQADLRGANHNLDAKVDELAQLNMRLYEMNRLKDDFLANMSHELRTPLNSIIGFSEVLHGIDALTDKQKRYAQNIQKSGRVLLEMINDILDLAKIEAGKMELRPTEFDIDALLGAHCDMVRSLSDEKNIDLTVEPSADPQPLYQDQAKVQQILTNLLSNAIKFTPEGGRITVGARRLPDDRLEMWVTDTGIGIAEDDRRTIFEKFRQSSKMLENDGLTREYSGTGLGLSIVKELCKLLGGEITVESALGQGSTFCVRLPWTLASLDKSEDSLRARLQDLTRPQVSEFVAASSETPKSA